MKCRSTFFFFKPCMSDVHQSRRGCNHNLLLPFPPSTFEKETYFYFKKEIFCSALVLRYVFFGFFFREREGKNTLCLLGRLGKPAWYQLLIGADKDAISCRKLLKIFTWKEFSLRRRRRRRRRRRADKKKESEKVVAKRETRWKEKTFPR